MEFLHVVILTAVEGITEFLPISSTGHLILVSRILNLESSDFLKTFEITIQFGAILSVVVLYFKKFLDLSLVLKLFISFIPTAIVGFFLYPFIKGFLLGSSAVTLAALFLGGIVLLFIDRFFKNTSHQSRTTIHYFLIGLFQSLSVIPGVSRAAATIIGGLAVGLNRKSATEFSFLLAVPTMLAATCYDIYQSLSVLHTSNFKLLASGMLLSFAFALLAIKFLIGYVKNHTFKAFGVYRIGLAIVYFLLMNS